MSLTAIINYLLKKLVSIVPYSAFKLMWQECQPRIDILQNLMLQNYKSKFRLEKFKSVFVIFAKIIKVCFLLIKEVLEHWLITALATIILIMAIKTEITLNSSTQYKIEDKIITISTIHKNNIPLRV